MCQGTNKRTYTNSTLLLQSSSEIVVIGMTLVKGVLGNGLEYP